MKNSLVPNILNSGISTFWSEHYPAMLSNLGFDDKTAGFMVASAVKEMEIFGHQPVRLPFITRPTTSRSEKIRQGTNVLRRALGKVA